MQRLRYKDFQLVAKPCPLGPEASPDPPGLDEVEAVKEFGDAMEKRGISHWWASAMGFSTP